MLHIPVVHTHKTSTRYKTSQHAFSNHINTVLGKDPREANAGKWSQVSAWKRTGETIQQNK